jgi:hypothetical protein
MIYPGLESLKSWEPIEYAAGFRARLAAIPVPEKADHSWQCGWEDADTETLELARHKRVLAEGREDDYADTWVFCSTQEGTRDRMAFRLMRRVRSLGKKVGSRRTSIWE